MINHSEKEYMKMHTGITESLFCRAEINIVNTYFNKYTDFKKLHFFYEESGLCFPKCSHTQLILLYIERHAPRHGRLPRGHAAQMLQIWVASDKALRAY